MECYKHNFDGTTPCPRCADENSLDARRYRYLCESREWPEAVNAAIDCGSKALIDDAIDAACKAEGG